jgi:predicted adenine nucleotide alpha hydrolase (AANH) superfamily ATPase
MSRLFMHVCCTYSGLKEVRGQNADGNYLNSYYYDPSTVIISQDLLRV